MPSPNVLKIDVEDSFYHIFARGASKQAIFVDELDYLYFENLFARYLSNKPMQDKQGMAYPNYNGSIELLAFCLMPNHFHLLVYQIKTGAMEKLMRSMLTSYSRYFNLKYKRSGSLLESRYKAVRITEDNQLQHISRYIHLNPRYWKRYKHTSLLYYLGNQNPEWLKPGKISGLFSSSKDYLDFVADYDDYKRTLDKVKSELAGK